MTAKLKQNSDRLLRTCCCFHGGGQWRGGSGQGRLDDGIKSVVMIQLPKYFSYKLSDICSPKVKRATIFKTWKKTPTDELTLWSRISEMLRNRSPCAPTPVAATAAVRRDTKSIITIEPPPSKDDTGDDGLADRLNVSHASLQESQDDCAMQRSPLSRLRRVSPSNKRKSRTAETLFHRGRR